MANSSISCLDGFKLAKKLNVNPMEIADICKKENIKIDNCELGVFGTHKFSEKNEEIYNQLLNIADDKNRVPCLDAWKLAQNYSLNKVGSTTKKVI
ncbi:ModE family transcriptional regulator [Sulfurimonas sp.]|uniref:ModE family transcriptional regulator n=1 Tax=Sulfurimonas sp. TaxID=2022749 RepID=UPI002AB082B8|nr:ModE family transcriptional regulator [Sulfurimonas sp.]